MIRNISVNLSEEEVAFVKWLAGRDGVSERTELESLFSLQLREEMELHGEEFIAERSRA